MFVHKEQFYTSFENFIEEVIIVHQKRNNLIGAFPAFGAIFGTGLIDLIPIVGVAVRAIGLSRLKKTIKEKSKSKEVIAEINRIKAAEKIYNELSNQLSTNEDEIKKEIDVLFEELVEGKDIHY